MTKKMYEAQKKLAIILAVMSIIMVAAPIIRGAIPDEIRIDPWEVEIPTSWERRVQDGKLAELSETEVPEWYFSHGELNAAEATALEQYETEYPEMEVGERPIPCTVNGVRGIVYKEKGQIYMNLGPITKRIVG